MFFLILIAAGLLVSLSSVFLGLGGGILLVPLLPDLFGITLKQAVATSITTIFFVVIVNTYKFHQARLVEWRIVVLMGPASLVTSFLAARLSTTVDPKWILITLAVILALVAVRGIVMSMSKIKYEVVTDLSTGQKAISVGGGALAGAASGFAGIGSGAILSPLMIILKIIEPAKLSPTANANMLFATGAGTLGFLTAGEFQNWSQWGNIRLDIAAGIFVVATILGGFLRPHQNKLPFIAKAILLNFLLLFLIGKVVYMLTQPV